MINGLVFVSSWKYFRACIIFGGILFWLQWAIIYGNNSIGNRQSYKIGLTSFISKSHRSYSIDAKHIVFLRSLDLTLWFAVQFVRQIRFPHGIMWQKIRCKWSQFAVL